MGGSVNVAIRFSSGETICSDYWTNLIPDWLLDPRMFREDEDYIKEWITRWDHKDHKAEWSYGGPRPVQNSEYGLIVWDYVSKTILNNNAYTDLHTRPFVSCMSEGQIRSNLCRLIEDDRVRLYSRNFTTGESKVLPENNPTAIKRDIALYQEKNRGRGLSVALDEGIVIDFKPFSLYHFPDHDTKHMRQKLKDIGFPMSRKDGLNATRPPFQRFDDNISPAECLARQMFCLMKESTHSDYALILFDQLSDECQTEFMDGAHVIMDTPVMHDRINNAIMYGKKVTFGIDPVLRPDFLKVAGNRIIPEDD